RHLGLPTLVDEAFQVAKPDILASDAELHQHLETGDPGGPAAGGNQLDVFEFLARHNHRIGRGSPHDDGGAMLIIVEDGDIHALAAKLFNDETVWRLDVFKVDRAEGWLQRADDFGQFDRVIFIHLDVKTVDIGEFL